jgi:hypothetical protein
MSKLIAGIVPVVNLSRFGANKLVLSADVLADIMPGGREMERHADPRPDFRAYAVSTTQLCESTEWRIRV